jgi:molybdate transport system ATP-binding protein
LQQFCNEKRKMSNPNIISLKNCVARNPAVRMAKPINLKFSRNEHIAIMGPNGGGKSLLVDSITGRYPMLREDMITYDFSPAISNKAYDNIKYIAFRDTYGSADANYYYQQRWNTHDIDNAPSVGDSLGDTSDTALRDELFDLFNVRPLLDKKLILLSSGELRKFQLTKTLLTNPRVLIMDNPFIGLDAHVRDLLDNLLTSIAAKGNLQIILVLSMLDSVPNFITHVVPVEGLMVGEKRTREEYLYNYRPKTDSALSEKTRRAIVELPYGDNLLSNDHVVDLHKVSIRYGSRTILKELDWSVMQGEKWALSGENGAGKSTLLSLVCADNPQSYACDIDLFGRKRGSGESIWEIKKHIGYVSPEMHRAYQRDLPSIDIVASGLHDSIGLYVRPKPEQRAICEFWMNVFGVDNLKDRTFLKLSSGEQRLVLLARAFVKDPELLILDEPLHGLDTENRRLVKDVIEAFNQRKDKTMIMVTHYANELPPSINKKIFLTKNN